MDSQEETGLMHLGNQAALVNDRRIALAMLRAVSEVLRRTRLARGFNSLQRLEAPVVACEGKRSPHRSFTNAGNAQFGRAGAWDAGRQIRWKVRALMAILPTLSGRGFDSRPASFILSECLSAMRIGLCASPLQAPACSDTPRE